MIGYNKCTVCFSIDRDNKHKLIVLNTVKRRYKKDRESSMSEIVDTAIEEYFENHKEEIDALMEEYHEHGGGIDL